MTLWLKQTKAYSKVRTITGLLRFTLTMKTKLRAVLSGRQYVGWPNLASSTVQSLLSQINQLSQNSDIFIYTRLRETACVHTAATLKSQTPCSDAPLSGSSCKSFIQEKKESLTSPVSSLLFNHNSASSGPSHMHANTQCLLAAVQHQRWKQWK